MKLGVFTVLLRDLPFERMLDTLQELGVEAVEIGTGNYPGSHHCDPDELLADGSRTDAFRKAVESRGMLISALSQHGNPLHPQDGVADASHQTWRKSVLLAERLEVPVVNAFSGCPGDSEGSRYPNWATCAWPDDFLTVLDWQWNEKAIPYWTAEAAYAQEHGVKIGFEMHPGFVVVAINGVLDTKHYGRLLERAWVFRTVGYGHGERVWRDIISALRAVGYDYVLSIEHEDSYLSIDEGLRRGIQTLQSIIIREPVGQMWWA